MYVLRNLQYIVCALLRMSKTKSCNKLNKPELNIISKSKMNSMKTMIQHKDISQIGWNRKTKQSMADRTAKQDKGTITEANKQERNKR